MVILITGATRCGKTLLTQRLLEKYKYPYWSIDLLKTDIPVRLSPRPHTPSKVFQKIAFIFQDARQPIVI